MVKKETYSRMHYTKMDRLLKDRLRDFCGNSFAPNKMYKNDALSKAIRCFVFAHNKLYWKTSGLKAVYHEV